MATIPSRPSSRFLRPSLQISNDAPQSIPVPPLCERADLPTRKDSSGLGKEKIGRIREKNPNDSPDRDARTGDGNRRKTPRATERHRVVPSRGTSAARGSFSSRCRDAPVRFFFSLRRSCSRAHPNLPELTLLRRPLSPWAMVPIKRGSYGCPVADCLWVADVADLSATFGMALCHL